jgi:hypothetical protein
MFGLEPIQHWLSSPILKTHMNKVFLFSILIFLVGLVSYLFINPRVKKSQYSSTVKPMLKSEGYSVEVYIRSINGKPYGSLQNVMAHSFPVSVITKKYTYLAKFGGDFTYYIDTSNTDSTELITSLDWELLETGSDIFIAKGNQASNNILYEFIFTSPEKTSKYAVGVNVLNQNSLLDHPVLSELQKVNRYLKQKENADTLKKLYSKKIRLSVTDMSWAEDNESQETTIGIELSTEMDRETIDDENYNLQKLVGSGKVVEDVTGGRYLMYYMPVFESITNESLGQ